MTLVHSPDLTSTSDLLVRRSASLNPDDVYTIIDDIVSGSLKARPIARYVGRDDIPHPPAPAWYIPDANDLYIHVDEAGIKTVPDVAWRTIWESKDTDLARVLGLYCHEAGHAAISDHMTTVQKANLGHFDLLTLLEELRVENHVVRKTPRARRFLRASFALVLGNLPDEFTSKGHVVRAWAIARGRTLGGVAAPDETEAVDTAARTILGDDIVDGLTDLLQEALTLRLHQDWARERMVEICDEWVALVGEPPESTGCTHCAREATEGEGTGSPSPGGAKPDDETDDGEGGGLKSAAGDDEEDDGHDDDGEHGEVTGSWGEAGATGLDDNDTDFDAGDDGLSDEDAELLAMLKRDLEDLMQDEWTRDLDATEIASAAEWAAKVFGNRRRSTRLEQREPTAEMRQHVVQVAAALSKLSLPTITKTARQTEVPPGRLRSREALRAAAERAQGRMVTAKPWRGTVRRHTTAKPVVVGIATDTSGSMKWAEHGVAEFAYVYTNAGHRIGARTAAVTFGDAVHRIARPGEVMTHVETKTANDGTESFDWAMAALDGVLHLTTPATAARILLIVSDGALVKGGEPDRAAEWLRRMDKAGTHVLWIGDRDMGMGPYGHWLTKLNRRLSHLQVIPVESAARRRTGGSVFDALNHTALAAIAAHVA